MLSSGEKALNSFQSSLTGLWGSPASILTLPLNGGGLSPPTVPALEEAGRPGWAGRAPVQAEGGRAEPPHPRPHGFSEAARYRQAWF